MEPTPKKSKAPGERQKKDKKDKEQKGKEKEKDKAKAAPAGKSNSNEAEDVGEYPESPRERFQKKSESVSPHQAGSSCKETGKQQKLEELQHVIRSPRIFSYQETGTQHMPMQQLQIDDFWQEQADKTKGTGKGKSKSEGGGNKTASAGTCLLFHYMSCHFKLTFSPSFTRESLYLVL